MISLLAASTSPRPSFRPHSHHAALNALILNSAEFDAVADPAAILTGRPTVLVVRDSSPGSTHRVSIGALANLAGRASREYDEVAAGRHKRAMNKQGTIQGIATRLKRLRKPSAPSSSSCRNWNLKATRRHPEASSSSSRSDRLQLNVEALRVRLRRLSDRELLRFGKSARYMCSPEIESRALALAFRYCLWAK